ncbi:DUF402 domain-containing protein [Microlunatus speluncae]|uniref:DUF402 domain-containing protein n=1 Tax=Microlunatus speluncae TaxID=2594267 RepID=UPI0013756437|nr:DUF402 domain-containing protein [Microlunatus speluncae]
MTDLRSVTKIKLDGAVRTHWSRLITAAPPGTWLFAPEGTAVHYDSGELYTKHNTAGVQLLVPGEWWTAWWWQDRRWIGIDVTLPVTETDNGFRYTDLELDLWWRDGDCGIVDQDELREAVDQGRIDSDTATVAERVAAELRQRLRRDREFVEHGFTVLDRNLTRSAGSPD